MLSALSATAPGGFSTTQRFQKNKEYYLKGGEMRKTLTRKEYLSTLNTTRKSLLVVGLTLMSPIVIMLLLIAGSVEAFHFITKTKL